MIAVISVVVAAVVGALAAEVTSNTALLRKPTQKIKKNKSGRSKVAQGASFADLLE